MSILEKVLSPSWYANSVANSRVAMYNYYHPLMKAGSSKPFWHLMLFTSVAMYSTSYMARDYQRIKQKLINQEKAVHEYNEKHGIVEEH
ncbi:expressed unknown protein [Seminavis robusta]|uniref:Uncharacterized protein n=1 Tax=Seminavis robusta TaxID=568900 RepID=A0A9N8DIK8_9STRA|nr:expressed unknown protein [Seminavis robusta]|eukprot:Sro103_g052340.1 n/a (89) ;mRNA; r:18895-19403